MQLLVNDHMCISSCKLRQTSVLGLQSPVWSGTGGATGCQAGGGIATRGGCAHPSVVSEIEVEGTVPGVS